MTGRPTMRSTHSANRPAQRGQPEPVNGHISYWMHQRSVPAPARPALLGRAETDVCIIGGGLTGLWTAFWLTETSPAMSVAVVEAEQIGFGASGRSTGWLSGKLLGDRASLAAGPQGVHGVVDAQRACNTVVDDILELTADLRIDCAAVKGGYLECARTPAQLARLADSVRHQHKWGLTTTDRILLSATEARRRVDIEGMLGAVFSPHCARIDPAALTLGLADVVAARGVQIFEHSRVHRIDARQVHTDAGDVQCGVVVRATEAYSSGFHDRRRSVIPLLAPMAVTTPLSEKAWADIGWAGHECVSDAAHRYFYSVRTADGRIAFGGDGMVYRYGSRVDDGRGMATTKMRQALDALREDLFGAHDVQLEHVWCGPVAVPRDFTPTVLFDPATGQAEASGYVGQGLTGSYLAGRALADLLSGRRSEYTTLPWVGRRQPTWVPEPLRWLGATAVQALYARADAAERAKGSSRTSRWARAAELVGG